MMHELVMSYAVIIPILCLEGNPYLKGLLEALQQQSYLPKEVHLVIGDRRQGRAINFGVSQADTTYIATLDDDSFIDDRDLFKKLMTELEADSSLGMVGSACEIPDWASPFQKRAMRQIARRWFPTQLKTVDSDMVQHPCLMLRKSFFEQIGGEDEELIRGLDPVLRKKVRDANKRVAVVADTWVYHLLPNRWWALMKMYFRNGRGSGYASRHYPERVLELSDGYDLGVFTERRSFGYRLVRRGARLLKAFVQFKWIALSTDLAYGAGVLIERCAPTPHAEVPEIEKVESGVWSKDLSWVKLHHVQLRKKNEHGC